MQKLAIAMAVAAAIVIPSSLVSSSARADGYRHHHHHHWHHHHAWGDRDYEIIRWSYGDCKIWFDDNGPPWGDGWKVLKDGLPTWDAAWAKLGWLRSRGKCT
jgi:hypothetical protein